MNAQLKEEAKQSGGLEEVAVIGDTAAPVTPCGRCRQVLNELAELGDTDPVVWCAGEEGGWRCACPGCCPALSARSA